jgi:O-antigen ligase
LGALASVVDGVVQGGDRAQGLTPHPVFYGLISAAAVLVGIGLFAGENGALRIVGALVAIGGVIGVLGSGTRAAALILGLSVLFFAVASRSAKVVGALVGAALVALLFTVVAGSRLSDTPTVVRLRGGGYARLSTQGRSALRDDTLALIRRRGVTGAGFRYLVPAHNLLLGVIGATGVIGLSGFVLIVCRLGQRLAVVPRADPLAIAALSAVLAFFAASWVVNGGWDRWLWLLIATFGTVRWDSATGGA